MSSPPAIIQNVVGAATPIQALDNPPEGRQGIKISYPFTPTGLTSQSQILQLNAPGGLKLSQVVSLCIDNTANQNPLTITHGIFNETITVQPGSFEVVPTFSSKSFYPITLSLSASPSQPFTVDIIFLNYARPQYNIFGAGSQALNNTQETASSGGAQLFGVTGLLTIGQISLAQVNAGQYMILNGFDMELTDWGSTAVSQTQIFVGLDWGINGAGPGAGTGFWISFLNTGSTVPVQGVVSLTTRDGLSLPSPIAPPKSTMNLVLFAGWTNPASQISPVGHTPILSVNALYTVVTPTL